MAIQEYGLDLFLNFSVQWFSVSVKPLSKDYEITEVHAIRTRPHYCPEVGGNCCRAQFPCSNITVQVGDGDLEARLYQNSAVARQEFTSNYKNNFTCSFVECVVDKITFFQGDSNDGKNFEFITGDSSNREMKIRKSLLELYISKFSWEFVTLNHPLYFLNNNLGKNPFKCYYNARRNEVYVEYTRAVSTTWPVWSICHSAIRFQDFFHVKSFFQTTDIDHVARAG